MKEIQSVAHALIRKHPGDAHKLTRREFIKLTAMASGGLGLWLSGCRPGGDQGGESEGPLAVVDQWIRAVNAEDVAGFEKLHAETVFATSQSQRDPYSGREEVWEVYRVSTGRQIEKITAFSQGQSACLLVNATKFSRSQCYVFNFGNGLIDRVYEYSSGGYDLASSPQFSGIEIVTDDTGLQERLDAMDHMFVDGLNNRDFSSPDVTDSTILFPAGSSGPVIGRESIAKFVEDAVSMFPSMRNEKIETFGQGNLVCTHVMTTGNGKPSWCYVGVFQDGRMGQLYEFLSSAQVDG